MLGLCAGLAVSTFSKTLAVILGLLVVGVQVIFPILFPLPPPPNLTIVLQVASSYGINVIPYHRLQKYVTSIDLHTAVQDNVAFKISFGTTFAMAAFMKL